jgi:DNA (cytosine-5)-methyltransferase 1
MFSGYGGASFALKKLGIEFEIVGYSEIDKYAIQCYNQNHHHIVGLGNKSIIPIQNFGDCAKIDPDLIPNFDLLTGGFPCQSFSVAGKCLGELDTRGTLFNDIIRIAEVKQPKFMLLENVKGLLSKRHKVTFDKIISELNRIGYLVNWKVLNSKDFGIPQNRERVFFVCKHKSLFNYPSLCESVVFKFDWPKPVELKLFLKDILEKEVDEKYTLSQLYADRISLNTDKVLPQGNAYKIIGTTQNPNAKGTNSRHWIYDTEFCVGCLNATMYKQPHQILIRNATKKGYLEAKPGDGINLEHPDSKTRRGRVQPAMSSTLQTNDQRGVLMDDCKLRKLTPTECFRLMGFLDDEINLEGISNNQRYKLAGNGWDINLVSKIFQKMFS